VNFSIEIRNAISGEAKTFASKQDVANFLAGKDRAEWEGYQNLGELPEPELEERQDAVVAEAHQEPAPRVMRAKFAVEAVENVSETQQNVYFRGVSGTWPYPADGSDENNTYAKFSPMAEARFGIANPNLRDAFAVGDEFYADFTLAKKAAHPEPEAAPQNQQAAPEGAAPEGNPESKA
jgi:hypothetical protein